MAHHVEAPLWPPLWPPLLDAMRRALAGPREARAGPRALGLRRRYGASNWLYIYRHGDRAYCLKLYRTAGQDGLDGPARAEREWRALSLLAAHHYPHAPRPVYFAPEPPAAVVLEYAAGRAIREQRLTRPLLAALAEALRAMHLIAPDPTASGPLPVLVDAEAQQRWLAARLRAGPDGRASPRSGDPRARRAVAARSGPGGAARPVAASLLPRGQQLGQ